jgi:nucleoside-diphosphate-sugar epimerase
MIVAITGGRGFIGRRLVERHRNAGDTVRLLTRQVVDETHDDPRITYFRGDLSQPCDVLTRFVDGADVLYHCAGEIRNPAQMTAVHVVGTEQLIAAARGRVGRWVQLSSAGVYGPHRDGVIDESTVGLPQGIYEVTKSQADALVTAAGDDGAFAYAILRPTIVFGPDMPNRSLFQWIAMIARRWFFFVGRPGASANYIEVDNVIDALQLCATHPRAVGQAFNLSDWRSVESFVGTIAAALGQSPPRWRLPEMPLRWLARCLQQVPRMPLTESRVLALCTRARYPIDKIAKELQYEHRITIETGLERMVACWRTQQGQLG